MKTIKKSPHQYEIEGLEVTYYFDEDSPSDEEKKTVFLRNSTCKATYKWYKEKYDDKD